MNVEAYIVMIVAIIGLGLVLTRLDNRKTTDRRIRNKVCESYGKIPSHEKVDWEIMGFPGEIVDEAERQFLCAD